MENIGNACIISLGYGGWYGQGVSRLERSLVFQGWAGEILTWKNELPVGCPNPNDYPYAFKVYAFEEAFKRGHRCVLWADASFWAVSNPVKIFDYISDNGLYFFKSGYMLAQTATDRLCEYAGVQREQIAEVSEFATGLIGINIDNPNGAEFFHRWRRQMLDGMFLGNREHDEADSKHPLFKFSRQDQSSASMVLHQMGIKTAGEDRDWVAYKNTNFDPERVIFFIEGL